MRLPLLQTFAACFAVSAMGAEDVLFNRDVQPILSDKCFACHGFDEKTREADLRLDSFEGATKDTDGVRAIVPRDLAKSEAWLRITTDDEDDLMPPKKSHKKLSAREKDVLKRWIEQGAKYQRHWSLEAPTRAALPAVQKKDWVRNPIDAFVLARLEKEGIAPAPEADRRTLARRLWLDLTGLPPSPEEVNAFVNDPAPDAYERLVRRLMDSPHWGEHRGRYWLDAARYADTHGLHFDNFREMFPYRDWVINAFNRNQPFDLFTIEQLAGDLLPKPTREQLIATGFQRCNATTNEGGTIDDENLANYANDRVTTLSWVWFGLSANCAACHDHKFDPITQKDFYSMAAFFRNTTQPPKDGNVRESRPILYLPKQDDEKRFAELQTEVAQARDAHGKRRAELEKQFGEWVKTATPGDLEINPEKLAVHYRLNDNAGSLKGVISGPENKLSEQARATTIEWQDGGRFGRAPVLPAEGVELGDIGKFEKDQPFSVAAWIKVPQETTVAAVAGRFDDRGATRQGWVIYLEGAKLGLRISAGDSKNEIRASTRRTLFRGGAWQHIVATYDGSGTAAGIQIAVDGREEAMVPAGEPLKASIAVDVPLRLGRRETGQPFTGGSIQDFRIYARKLPGYEIKALQQLPSLRRALALPLPPPEPPKTETAEAKSAPAAPAPVAATAAAPAAIAATAPAAPAAPAPAAAPAVAAATAPPAAPAVAEAKKKKRAAKKEQTAAEGEPAFRKPEQTAALLEFYLGNKDAELRRMADQIATLDAEDKAIKSRSTVTLVQEEKPNNEPMAHVLMRGQYDKPGDQVPAATFSALHAFPANAPKNRLGLAEWVVAKENPLTARVTVNRFWQELFGTGLVRTSEDFGIMGDLPSHPELLDWLAVDFRESGWDTKRFFMQMVTSATYRQAAVLTQEKRERDPQNRLLSRGPRFRMDAEMIRDYALAASTTLVPKIGGPSVKPYQPVGVWEAVAMPESNTRNYKPDTGEGLYRRSLYTFWKRAAPPAVMDILNAPSRETCAVRRERTNTPLQALATMNDPQFVEAARRLAELALQKASEDPQKAIAFMAERVLLRPLAEAEQKIVAETYSIAEREFSERPDSAKQYTVVGESKPNASLPPVKLAALALVANQLLCLDEALNK